MSIWDPVGESWEAYDAGEIRIILEEKKFSLSRYYDFRENHKHGVFKRRDHIALATLRWKTTARAKLKAFVERFEVSSQIGKRSQRIIDRYKTVFYFRLPNEGILTRVRSESIPDEIWGDASEAFEALVNVQEKIEKASQFSGPTWIRLESKSAVVAKNRAFSCLLGSNSRYHLLGQLELPCGGNFPFLSDPSLYQSEESQEDPDGTLEHSSEVFESTSVEHNNIVNIGEVYPQNIPKEEDLAGANEDFEETKLDSSLEKELQSEEEVTIRARLKDIERELELLREKETLMKKLENIKQSRAKESRGQKAA
ncbi:hypothetical protein TWF694_007785 [Orbilia ellipsospora]|uniref:Uncharacterized protein n=1 Tax=Orbilia ellipsospora TaxID=2528407 RepID=A0AAV9XJ85_9PEZI